MCNCKCKHRCTELQQVITAGPQNFLPDDTRIRRNLINSVYIQPSDPAGSLTYLSPQGKTLASWSVLNSSYLYVYNQNGTRIATIPLAELIRTTEAPEPLAVSWKEVDPTQSYILVNTTAAGYDATHAIMIMWGLECDECGLTPNNL